MGVKGIIDKYPNLSIKQIEERIKMYDTVSFDIFDTLLKRNVCSAYDVFDLVEREYNRKHDYKISDFRKKRIEAEIWARNQAIREEITLKEIYTVLADKENEYLPIVNELAFIEEKIEYEISCPNLLIQSVYKHCLKQNKRIIIISDMYLSKDSIKKMLLKNGYDTYDELYVSSDIGIQKRSGELYNYVLKKDNIKKGAVIHIGDNKRSDLIAARKAGFATVNIAREHKYTKYFAKSDNLDQKILYAFINNRIPFIKNQIVSIGYEVYGPLLYLFVRWLSMQLDNNKTTLFFSRDCYVVKAAYEIITGQSANTVYFYGSRKSLTIPALYKDSSLENLSRLVKSEPARMTIEDLLIKIGLIPEKFKEKLNQFSLGLDDIVQRDHLNENKAFVMFYESIRKDIKHNSRNAYEGFFKYFNSLNCTENIQVVDIGWRCTMQYCLMNLLPSAYKLHGYYVGVREDALIPQTEYTGLYLNGENREDKKVFLASMTALIEIFFSAPHGSVEGYSKDGNALYGLYECEADKNSAQLVKHIQTGALNFVRDFSGNLLSEMIDLDPEFMFSGLKVLGTEPRKEELEVFSEFPFHMGIGVVKAADPDVMMAYITNPQKFIYDFLNSNWKIGFLKKILKIRLPYYKIFEIIYRCKG